MTEQFRPQPENPKHNAPEAGTGPLGLPPPSPEQAPQGEGSKSPELNLSGQAEDTAPAQEGLQSTHELPQIPAHAIGNCIVRDLMPSSERVDEMLAEGLLSDGQAVVEKRGALLRERHYALGDRVVAIQNLLDGGGLPAEEKRSLRAESKNLKKVMRRIRREQQEND